MSSFLDQIADFAEDVIRPHAARWSMGEEPSRELYNQASNIGIFGLEIPQDKGGLGLPFSVKSKAFEIMAGADFGFAMSLVNTHNVGARLVASATNGLQNRYLPSLLGGEISACTALTEPGAGSDVAAISSCAKKTSDGWLLTGEKTWIINARHAGLSIVFAQCGAESGADHIGGFLVDLTANGVTRYPIDTEFSQTSMGTGGFLMKDVALDDDCLLLPPGRAFKEIMNEINGARIYVAAMCLGMLKTAALQAAAYGQRRRAFGKPLQEHAPWQAGLDAVQAEITVLEEMIEAVSQQFELGRDTQLIAAKSKIDAVSACQKHLPNLLHAMGAEGLKPDYCFSRHLSAAQIAGLTDGANSMLRARVEKLGRRQVASTYEEIEI